MFRLNPRGVMILLLVLGLYYIQNQETVACDEAYRATQKKESFAKTTSGITHYELVQGKGPTVVLIHGVSGPMKVWDKTVRTLKDKGLTVLRYDLFGRGLSDRINGEYNEELYDKQLAELLGNLKIQTPVTLVGSSMGAIVSAGFANRHPELVNRVVLIGPAGFPIKAASISKMMYVPFLGELIMESFGNLSLVSHHKKYFIRPDDYTEMHRAFEDQLKFKDTKKAILSTMRRMPIQDYQKGYEELGCGSKPILLVWGKEDATFPFENHTKAQAYMPRAKFVAVDGAAHLPQYENPGAVSDEILSFVAGS